MIEQTKPKEEIKGETFIGSLILKPGQKIFEVNKTTNEIKLAEFEKVDHVFNPETSLTSKRNKLIVNNDCIYISALNLKNAMRKYEKGN